MSYLIDMSDAVVSYPSEDGGRRIILNNIGLKVREGEFVTVVGPSGCGKSTLLRLILGTQFPNQGTVTVDGNPVKKVTRDCGIVYQGYTLYPFLTVLQNIMFGRVLEKTNLLDATAAKPLQMLEWSLNKGAHVGRSGAQLLLSGMFARAGRYLSTPLKAPRLKAPAPGTLPIWTRGLERWFHYFQVRKEAREEAQQLLVKVGLDPNDGDKFPYELSGGMRQRVAIAQSILMKPKIILLDEPFGALDAKTRSDMQDFIHDCWAEHGITVFFVTHDLDEAVKLGTRLVCVSQYWTDENGQKGKGARIVRDRRVEGGTTRPSEFHGTEEFNQLIHSISQAGLDSSKRLPLAAFDLSHPDAIVDKKEAGMSADQTDTTPVADKAGGTDETAVVAVVAAAPPPPPAPPAKDERPRFIQSISRAYNNGKSVVVLTGATRDLFFNARQGRFLELEQSIYQAYADPWRVLRFDIATGIDFYNPDDLSEVQKTVNQIDKAVTNPGDKVRNIRSLMDRTRHDPLPALMVLRDILESVKAARLTDMAVKPLCIVVQFAPSLFPAGNFDRLSELDRQRLVTFLNMVESPWFKNSGHLFVLVAGTRAEINAKITELPSVQCVEIPLPNDTERTKFVDTFAATRPTTRFQSSSSRFVIGTAGLKLTALREILETSSRSGEAISDAQVLEQVNYVLDAELSSIVSIPKFDQRPKDVVGYKEVGTTFSDVLRRCDNPETATSAILVSGPNGGGKTFTVQAYAADSNRVIIELKGLRGAYFGETDAFFEKFRLVVNTLGRILIFCDEAHTNFGSVHKSDTHETEKRLAGNIIKMMGDTSLLGKVVWVLATSRPDELDPDVKSRAPEQIAILDLEGDDRREFVTQIFARKKIKLADGDFESIFKQTAEYSNRDFSNLVRKVMDREDRSVEAVLKVWRASKSIIKQRRLQSLIAMEHCSYPLLLPEKMRDYVGTTEYEQEVRQLKASLNY